MWLPPSPPHPLTLSAGSQTGPHFETNGRTQKIPHTQASPQKNEAESLRGRAQALVTGKSTKVTLMYVWNWSPLPRASVLRLGCTWESVGLGGGVAVRGWRVSVSLILLMSLPIGSDWISMGFGWISGYFQVHWVIKYLSKIKSHYWDGDIDVENKYVDTKKGNGVGIGIYTLLILCIK